MGLVSSVKMTWTRCVGRGFGGGAGLVGVGKGSRAWRGIIMACVEWKDGLDEGGLVSAE
jgi:hypothetical protein